MAFKRIYIVSGPIQTGKSSRIFEWSKQVHSIAGLLSLVQDGKRTLFNLQSKNTIPFEANQSNANEACIGVGKYQFYESGFELGVQALKNALVQAPDFLVLDEIGKLEIEQSNGFHAIFLELLNNYKMPGNGILLLVIRDSLLQKAIEKYQLHDAIIANTSLFDQAKQINGLVLSGGQSNRMGFDKSEISYFSEKQDVYLYHQLSAYCDSTFISIQTKEQKQLEPDLTYLIDDVCFGNNGPMTALLTAIQSNPFCSWLLWACDYPLLNQDDMKGLVNAFYQKRICTTLTKNEKLPEPVLAIYDINQFAQLRTFYTNQQFSLFKFLSSIPHYLVHIKNPENIWSVDTPEAFEQAKKILSQDV